MPPKKPQTLNPARFVRANFENRFFDKAIALEGLANVSLLSVGTKEVNNDHRLRAQLFEAIQTFGNNLFLLVDIPQKFNLRADYQIRKELGHETDDKAEKEFETGALELAEQWFERNKSIFIEILEKSGVLVPDRYKKSISTNGKHEEEGIKESSESTSSDLNRFKTFVNAQCELGFINFRIWRWSDLNKELQHVDYEKHALNFNNALHLEKNKAIREKYDSGLKQDQENYLQKGRNAKKIGDQEKEIKLLASKEFIEEETIKATIGLAALGYNTISYPQPCFKIFPLLRTFIHKIMGKTDFYGWINTGLENARTVDPYPMLYTEEEGNDGIAGKTENPIGSLLEPQGVGGLDPKKFYNDVVKKTAQMMFLQINSGKPPNEVLGIYDALQSQEANQAEGPHHSKTSKIVGSDPRLLAPPKSSKKDDKTSVEKKELPQAKIRSSRSSPDLFAPGNITKKANSPSSQKRRMTYPPFNKKPPLSFNFRRP